MDTPDLLTRPLATRIADLTMPKEWTHGSETPESAIAAAIKALNDGKTHYTDRPGILGLRTWVSQFVKQHFRVEIAPDDITITCGGTEARFVAIKLLTESSSTILCPNENKTIRNVAQLIGVDVVSQVDDPSAISLVYLHPEMDDNNALLHLAKEHQWWIIWDVSGTTPTSFHPSHDGSLAKRVVTIGSLSDRLAGWRIGWMAGSEKAKQLRAYKQSMTICSPSISQWAALGMVENS